MIYHRRIVSEKPLTETLDQARTVQGLFDDKAISLNFVERYSPIVNDVRQLIDDEGLSIVRANFFWGKYRLHDHRPTMGILSEISHPIDLILWLAKIQACSPYKLKVGSAIASDFSPHAPSTLESVNISAVFDNKLLMTGTSSFVWEGRDRRVELFMADHRNNITKMACLRFDKPLWDIDHIDCYDLTREPGRPVKLWSRSIEREEISTQTFSVDKISKFLKENIDDLNGKNTPNALAHISQGVYVQGILTFAIAAESYIECRKPSDRDEKQILALVKVLGERFIDELVQDDLVQAAEILMPKAKPANMNRWIMRPAACVLHHAANNKWCDWQRIRLFKEPRPKTRATTPDVARVLIQAAPKLVQKLFLLWLFKHGERVTDAANIEWSLIDFENNTYRHYERKNDKWRTAPLDDEVLVLLLKHRKASKDKKTEELPRHVFPWRSRHSVYNWLIPLRDEVGVTFTPHMARHTVGTMLNAQGASLRTIMDRLGHTDVKSSLRYQAGDIEVVREAGKRLPRLG